MAERMEGKEHLDDSLPFHHLDGHIVRLFLAESFRSSANGNQEMEMEMEMLRKLIHEMERYIEDNT